MRLLFFDLFNKIMNVYCGFKLHNIKKLGYLEEFQSENLEMKKNFDE